MTKSNDAALTAVWKETAQLADVIELQVPQGSQFLKVADQEGGGGALTFWFLVPDLAGLHGDKATDRARDTRRFRVLGTGHTANQAELDGANFIDTVVTAGGALVWHIFDIGEARG